MNQNKISNWVGVDLGGTNLRTMLTDDNGNCLKEKAIATRSQACPEDLLNDILSLVTSLLDGKKAGLGIGMPGWIDLKQGIVIKSPNLPAWDHVPVRKYLVDQGFPGPIYIQNDVNCMTWGEFRLGAGKTFKSFLCVTLGTGIGGGLILQEKFYGGPRGMAGEIGHTVLFPDGEKCACGGAGCLEAYAGKNAILRIYSEISALNNKPKSLTPAWIYEQAKKGDTASLKTWEKVGEYLGIAFSGAVQLLDLDGIVIGGTISSASEFLFPSIRKKMKDLLPPFMFERVSVSASVLGPKTGMVGAALWAREEYLQESFL